MNEDRVRIIENLLSQLQEHFDSAQIVCTAHDPAIDQTVIAYSGFGNIYARRGACDQWLAEVEMIELRSAEEEGDES